MAHLTYLDYAASAPLDPVVAAAMHAVEAMPGNPSSVHQAGRELRAVIDAARASVARLLAVEPGAVTFASGATEANALAITGAWRAMRHGGKLGARPRILTSPLEHASVWEAVQRIAAEDGAAVDVLPVGMSGVVDAADVARMLTPDTVLVSVTWANNVLGTVQPIAEIGRMVATERTRRLAAALPVAAGGAVALPIVFHSDAVQAVVTQDVLPGAAGVDLLTLSGHKICGPKGVGALIRTRRDVPLEPLVMGGGQEGGLRHGTENAAAIVGMGAAAEALLSGRAEETARCAALRRGFMEALAQASPRAEVVGDAERSVPTTVFVRLPGVPGDRLMLALDAAGFAASAGSACDAGSRRASRTLTAVLDEQRALHGGVRVSFGRFTAAEDLAACARAIGAAR